MKTNKSTHPMPSLFVHDLKVMVNKYQPDDVVMVSPKGYEDMLNNLIRGKNTDIAIEFERAEILATRILNILNTSSSPKSDVRKYILREYGLSDDND